jgi:hypothetical protein
MPTHTKNKPRTSTKNEVHRTLHLTTPLLQGKDVENLQHSINGLVKHYEFPWMAITPDGEYGKRSARKAAFVMELIGLDSDLVHKTRHTGHLSEATQRLIRNPQKRTDADRKREDNRKSRFQKLRKQHKEGLSAAVDAMIKHVGVKENPPESNMGPFPITACQAHFGLDHQPWCGCCAGFFIEVECNGGQHTGTWWPYAGSIRTDAEAGKNGLEDINPAHAHKGCIATFFSGGDDHVGLVRADSENGILFTVEGNTSSARQDSDGGIIEIKERSFSEVTCVAVLNLALI